MFLVNFYDFLHFFCGDGHVTCHVSHMVLVLHPQILRVILSLGDLCMVLHIHMYWYMVRRPVWSKISTRGRYIDSNFISLALSNVIKSF